MFFPIYFLTTKFKPYIALIVPSVLNPNCSFCNFPSLASFHLGYSHIFCKLCHFVNLALITSLFYSSGISPFFHILFIPFQNTLLISFDTSMLCFPFLLLPESFIFFSFLDIILILLLLTPHFFFYLFVFHFLFLSSSFITSFLLISPNK